MRTAEVDRMGSDVGRQALGHQLHHGGGELGVLARHGGVGGRHEQVRAHRALRGGLGEDAKGARGLGEEERAVGRGGELDAALLGELPDLLHEGVVAALDALRQDALEGPAEDEPAAFELGQQCRERALLGGEAGDLRERLLRRGGGAAGGGRLPHRRQVLNALQRGLQVAPGDGGAEGEHGDAGREGALLLRLGEHLAELGPRAQAQVAAQDPGGHGGAELLRAAPQDGADRGEDLLGHGLAHALKDAGEDLHDAVGLEALEVVPDLLGDDLGARVLAQQGSQSPHHVRGRLDGLRRALGQDRALALAPPGLRAERRVLRKLVLRAATELVLPEEERVGDYGEEEDEDFSLQAGEERCGIVDDRHG
mmetsp:Transcript_29286/g.77389  ORF Transcript_29286/g.77389 Transcript_29286/m.77389 type:complete len:367 (-) Transcript_29286:156-1256(-)